MKKYFKFIIAGLIALIFIGTFVSCGSSHNRNLWLGEFSPKVTDLKKSTVVTGKIEPRNEVNVETANIWHHHPTDETGW